MVCDSFIWSWLLILVKKPNQTNNKFDYDVFTMTLITGETSLSRQQTIEKKQSFS